MKLFFLLILFLNGTVMAANSATKIPAPPGGGLNRYVVYCDGVRPLEFDNEATATATYQQLVNYFKCKTPAWL